MPKYANRKPGDMFVVQRTTPCGRKCFIVAGIDENNQLVLTESLHFNRINAMRSLHDDWGYGKDGKPIPKVN
jgi:hypothetical protein